MAHQGHVRRRRWPARHHRRHHTNRQPPPRIRRESQGLEATITPPNALKPLTVKDYDAWQRVIREEIQQLSQEAPIAHQCYQHLSRTLTAQLTTVHAQKTQSEILPRSTLGHVAYWLQKVAEAINVSAGLIPGINILSAIVTSFLMLLAWILHACDYRHRKAAYRHLRHRVQKLSDADWQPVFEYVARKSAQMLARNCHRFEVLSEEDQRTLVEKWSRKATRHLFQSINALPVEGAMPDLATLAQDMTLSWMSNPKGYTVLARQWKKESDSTFTEADYQQHLTRLPGTPDNHPICKDNPACQEAQSSRCAGFNEPLPTEEERKAMLKKQLDEMQQQLSQQLSREVSQQVTEQMMQMSQQFTLQNQYLQQLMRQEAQRVFQQHMIPVIPAQNTPTPKLLAENEALKARIAELEQRSQTDALAPAAALPTVPLPHGSTPLHYGYTLQNVNASSGISPAGNTALTPSVSSKPGGPT